MAALGIVIMNGMANKSIKTIKFHQMMKTNFRRTKKNTDRENDN